MKTEKAKRGEQLVDTSYMKVKKAKCDFINETEDNSREISSQEMAATVTDAESTLTNPDDTMSSSDTPSSEDAQLFSKPSSSYIALIAKVILASPSQKLNLASIYRAMEEKFPYLKSRGPGWRNSVRHNLSVNDCFVKVSRCEDGRGHYWGVHHAYLMDFQQGNFRQCSRDRGRRERERYSKVTGCLAWMETSCFLGRFYESRSLQEPRKVSAKFSGLDPTTLSTLRRQCGLGTTAQLVEVFSRLLTRQGYSWKRAQQSTHDVRTAMLGDE
ncbi:Forkhead box protein D4 [Collichthys lucidus]|uniref:Forkhead box protein D4 n=1 Tax=Collichthys lucidus TaxID=240159 RepID=A0A4U5UHW3_COLLU|nr:Forkhead box protein D4 [Collichthys lucidus]